MNDKIMKAACLAAAKELYKERCASVGVKPGAWAKLDAKIRDGLVAEATEALAAPAPTEAPAAAEPTNGNAPAESRNALGGAARVVPDSGPAYEDFKPEHTHVVLDITRGNLRTPMKVPTSTMAPDVTSVMPDVMRSVIGGMLAAQQSPPGGQQPTHPVQPNRSYALQGASGRIWRESDRLGYADFTEEWSDATGTWPSLKVGLVDDAQAMTAQPSAPVAAQLGNPIVIGTEENAGKILGMPVQGQVPGPVQTPGHRDQGQARLA